MAIPTIYDPNMKLFQVKISSTSGFKGTGKDQGEYQRLITYQKCKKTRQDVSAIRQRINTIRGNGCMPFFGAYLTNELGISQLTQACRKADQDMKALDPEYHCTLRYYEIPMMNITGNKTIFDELLSDMKNEIFGVVLEQITEKIRNTPEGKTMTKKSKDALLNMCDRLSGLNIVDDPGVKKQIEDVKARINADQLAELRDDILVILDETKNRAGALELVAPIKISETEPDSAAPVPVQNLPKSRSLDL
jgi:hypothetical protein